MIVILLSNRGVDGWAYTILRNGMTFDSEDTYLTASDAASAACEWVSEHTIGE